MSLSGAKWQGAFQLLQQACQPVGLKGGWRDYCIVNAPERSGLEALELRRALVSVHAFGDAKRERVRTGTSEAPGVTGVSLARWVPRGRSTWLRRIEGAKRWGVGVVSGFGGVGPSLWFVFLPLLQRRRG